MFNPQSGIAGEPTALFAVDAPVLDCPEKAAEFFSKYPNWISDREMCLMHILSTRHSLIETVIVSVGSVDHTFMSPRDIMRQALLANGAAIIVCHTHPSGILEPSEDDKAVTRRLVRAGETIGVDVLDHLIMSPVPHDGSWVSMARRGLM